MFISEVGLGSPNPNIFSICLFSIDLASLMTDFSLGLALTSANRAATFCAFPLKIALLKICYFGHGDLPSDPSAVIGPCFLFGYNSYDWKLQSEIDYLWSSIGSRIGSRIDSPFLEQ